MIATLAQALNESYEAHHCLDCDEIVSVSGYSLHDAGHTLRAVTVIEGHWRDGLLNFIREEKK